MKSQIRNIDDHGIHYQALAFVCPGCVAAGGGSGLHLLPVNTDEHKPSWTWDGNLVYPTVTPSILTGKDSENVCHSFLEAGIFHFLDDCTHSLVGQYARMPDLPEWFTNETLEQDNNGD